MCLSARSACNQGNHDVLIAVRGEVTLEHSAFSSVGVCDNREERNLQWPGASIEVASFPVLCTRTWE